VVGAGPAGIVTAYFLQKHGIPYHVVDQAEVLASTWANLYPSLRLNTSRYFSHLPTKRFPLHWGTFPTAKQYHTYLTEFVAEHRLNIQLGVKIHSIMPENGGYQVESSHGSAWYPVIVLCTGRFSNPYTAPLNGLDEFKGIKLHAHDYHHPNQLTNKRVMVVGNGPSGIDIAVETGQHNKMPTLLAIRTGVSLKRRYPLGLSKHTWMLIADHLPKPLYEPIMSLAERWSEYPPAMLRGIKTAPTGQPTTAIAYRGDELIRAVRRGQVICVDAPTQIHTHGVTLTDGTTHDIDALIIATGYRPALGYLRNITMKPDEQGWPTRFNSHIYSIDYAKLVYQATYGGGDTLDRQFQPTLREVAGYAGLFHVGLYYKGKGAMYNFNVEAEIATEQIKIMLSVRQP
jgi:putative flavoprotein involved in K+ transport